MATRFILLEDIMYKMSYFKLHSNPFLRCLGPNEAKNVMQETHDGECGNHAGGRSLAHEAINQGYHWPNMFNDAKEYVKRCPQCQRFAPSQAGQAWISTHYGAPDPSCNGGWI